MSQEQSKPSKKEATSQDPQTDESIDVDQLARLYADDFDLFDESDAVSLEDLRNSYSQVVVQETGRSAVSATVADDEIQIFDSNDDESDQESHVAISPISIVEAVLMVGRPDGGPISATEIASLMRGVSEAEVDQLVAELNRDYVANNRALHIAMVSGAYRLELAEDLTHVRQRFLGPAREVRLNQASIDCLALVAYQPGITRETLDAQRRQSSGAILNQLVRRELLEMRREKLDNKLEPHYYPTARMLSLVGLESLDDLPTVEDWNG